MAHLMVDPIDPVIVDRITQLAVQVLDVPLVCVSLVDAQRHEVFSTYGLKTLGGAPLTPYVGMQLVGSDGRPVGTLTVMDSKPRRWNATELGFLRELAVCLVAQVDIGPVERMM